MSYYPFNTTKAQGMAAATEAPGVNGDLMWPFKLSLSAAEAVAADDDFFVTPAKDMQLGAYTLNATELPGGVARNVFVTVTQQGGVNDTMGTLEVVGEDIAGNAITETITPNANSTTAGVYAFHKVTSITGADWARDGAAGTEDHIKIGFGDIIGLPHMLTENTVLAAFKGGTKEGTAPTVVVDNNELHKNTVDLNSALDGNAVDIIYLV